MGQSQSVMPAGRNGACGGRSHPVPTTGTPTKTHHIAPVSPIPALPGACMEGAAFSARSPLQKSRAISPARWSIKSLFADTPIFPSSPEIRSVNESNGDAEPMRHIASLKSSAYFEGVKCLSANDLPRCPTRARTAGSPAKRRIAFESPESSFSVETRMMQSSGNSAKHPELETITAFPARSCSTSDADAPSEEG